jgi:hypothetical protein
VPENMPLTLPLCFKVAIRILKNNDIESGPLRGPAGPVTVPTSGSLHCRWRAPTVDSRPLSMGVVVRYLKLENNYIIILDRGHLSPLVTTDSTATSI